MENNINKEDILKIKESLFDAKSANRRSAAKKIGKKKIIELGDDLFKSYLKEKKDIRTWETQTEMIVANARNEITQKKYDMYADRHNPCK